MYASAAKLEPAQGHSNPFWGPPDPYLEAGKSIVPSAKSMMELGVSKGSTLVRSSSSSVPDVVQSALAKGWNVIDGSRIKETTEAVLPGFSETRGILPAHSSIPETPESFARQVEWAAKFMPVVDKLPIVALWYGLVELFLLRPGLDIYKEDIEEDRDMVVSETAAVTGVRFAVFCVIGVMTSVIFG